jgi:hypothetical protein
MSERILDKIDIFLNEKWEPEVEVKSTGEHAGKSVRTIKKQIKNLRGKAGNKEQMGELLFALRAKQGWKKGKGATGLRTKKGKQRKN